MPQLLNVTKKLGYVIIHYKNHISTFEGVGAITTINFLKCLTYFFIIISIYFTISAISSLKDKTMYEE